MRKRVLIICNAFDEFTRAKRAITTDSPAASRKVFLLCESLRLAGKRPCIISIGRGRSGYGKDYFPAQIRIINGTPIYYCAFSRMRLFSELLSLVAPLIFIVRLRNLGQTPVIFYNRMIVYIPTLILCWFSRCKNILDLEDGSTFRDKNIFFNIFLRLKSSFFDWFCSGGALLACDALAKQTNLKPFLTYYGYTAENNAPYVERMHFRKILMCGTLWRETGAKLLIDSIRQLRQENPSWSKELHFYITGSGEYLGEFSKLADEHDNPKLTVLGRIPYQSYQKLLRECDIGLALKLNSGSLANTTFPSKVVEFAESGLLVLTSDISDVRKIFDNSVIFLDDDSPRSLIALFEWALKNPVLANACAFSGRNKVRELLSADRSGRDVAEFIFQDR